MKTRSGLIWRQLVFTWILLLVQKAMLRFEIWWCLSSHTHTRYSKCLNLLSMRFTIIFKSCYLILLQAHSSADNTHNRLFRERRWQFWPGVKHEDLGLFHWPKLIDLNYHQSTEVAIRTVSEQLQFQVRNLDESGVCAEQRLFNNRAMTGQFPSRAIPVSEQAQSEPSLSRFGMVRE